MLPAIEKNREGHLASGGCVVYGLVSEEFYCDDLFGETFGFDRIVIAETQGSFEENVSWHALAVSRRIATWCPLEVDRDTIL